MTAVSSTVIAAGCYAGLTDSKKLKTHTKSSPPLGAGRLQTESIKQAAWENNVAQNNDKQCIQTDPATGE